MNGVYVVSDDACLFAETFAIDFARRKTADSPVGTAVVQMVSCHLFSFACPG